MFSKKIAVLLSGCFILSSVGCSEYLNGRKEEAKVIELSDKQFACLKDIPDQLMKFSVGEATPLEIRTGFDCMGASLTYFNKKTYGSSKETYTAEEMRRFFAKYFLKKNNVTPEFAAELMKIKKALLGGSESHISKEEIRGLVSIFSVLRDEAIVLSPHMRTLLDHNEQDAKWEEVSAAIAQLRVSAHKILNRTQIAKSDYSFEDGKLALKGFAEFIKGNDTFAPYEVYGQWVPVVESVKNILMGKKARFAGADQWGESLDILLDLYELALKYHYNIGDFQFENPDKVRQVSQFIQQGLSLLENSHQMKTMGVIPKEDIDNLIDQVLPKVTAQMTPFALKKVYKVVLNKILDPERKMDNRGLMGLERKHLASILREFNIWRLSQSFIDNVSARTKYAGNTQAELLAAYRTFDYQTIIRKGLTDDAFEQRALSDAWADFGDLLQNPVTMTFNEKGRMMVAANTTAMKQTWAGLTKFNLMRAVSRALMVGYADNATGRLNDAGLTQQALVQWYDDFQELGLDLKAFDPRSANSGARSFLEANFFTFSGNGDQVMDQKETFEFVSTLFSAGLGTSSSLSSLMKQNQCGLEDKDVFDQPFFDETCFKFQLRLGFADHFANMPAMVRYVQGLNAEQWDQFYHYLAAASVTPDQQAGRVETANIRTMVTILHYIEAVMIIYDKDGSQGLSLDEVYDSAPRFMSFLKTVSPVSWEYIVKQGFAHLVFKGSIPGAGGLIGFQWDKMWGLGEAQRMEIARLFGTLKDQLNKVPN